MALTALLGLGSNANLRHATDLGVGRLVKAVAGDAEQTECARSLAQQLVDNWRERLSDPSSPAATRKRKIRD